MDINGWLDQIVFYVASGLTVLAGSSGGFAVCLAWIKKKINERVEKLSTSKEDYDEKAAKLTTAAERLDAASETMKTVSIKLGEYAVAINGIKRTAESADEKYERIIKALSLMAVNDSYLVSNGVAKQITDILGTTEVVNTIDEVSNEADA